MGEVAPQCSWQAVLRLPFGASQKTAVHVHQELLSICFHLPLDWSSILANGVKFLKLPLPYGWGRLQASALGGRWSPPLLWAWGKLVLMSAVAWAWATCHLLQTAVTPLRARAPGGLSTLLAATLPWTVKSELSHLCFCCLSRTIGPFEISRLFPEDLRGKHHLLLGLTQFWKSWLHHKCQSARVSDFPARNILTRLLFRLQRIHIWLWEPASELLK